MNLHEIWRRMTAGRTSLLEAEIARLRACLAETRAENRALLDSIPGSAGIPPVPVSQVPATSHSESARADDESIFRPARRGGPPPPAAPADGAAGPCAAGNLSLGADPRPRNDSHHRLPDMRPIVPPQRRRSWHQITRILEIESARKPPASD